MVEGDRRTWWFVGGGIVVAAVVLAFVWFQPHKLFIDERVDESLPVASAGSDQADSGVEELARGEFVSIDHGTTGVVRVTELANGTRIVRLEDLATDNGPDLFLYLSTNPADGPSNAFDFEFVNLGRLKGNLGNQNYELPADVSLEDWTSVVVWCDRFDSAFGAADLVPA